MAREKEFIFEIELEAENGRLLKPHIAYRRDRTSPWTVDIDRTEISPTYKEIGHAQAFLRRHFDIKNNPNVRAIHYAKKSTLLKKLDVLPCDR